MTGAARPVDVPVPSGWTFTPAWATRALSSRYPGAVVGEVKQDDVDPGTTSRLRLHLGYRQGEGPETVFLKAQGRLGHRLMLGALELLTPEARLFASGVDLRARRPAVYAVGVDRPRLNSIVVMEDVAAEGARMNIATAPLSVDEVARGLTELARLHRRFWNDVPASLDFLRPWRIQHGWTLLALIGGIQGPPRLRRNGALDALPASLRRWDRCLWLSRRCADVFRQGPQTVLHGDTHIGNTYTLPDGSVGFLDWQLVRTGQWSYDVGYFVTSALTEADRRAHERSLLDGYLDELGAGLDRDEAWTAYRRGLGYGLTAWLETYASADYQPDDVSLTLLRRFATAMTDHDTVRLLEHR
jgi:hypothetical protein